ncbi:hypothetical protein PLESTB_001622600 [Pleodorina starrii]|uniref:Histone deacetylase domain-containing protein n=1 Tax=Pleodorina starrii TaxID=330485 RepID=A0A9W6BYC2_9CHLO|nr:hypothetical protein PLESTM_002041000 [Pleodorina starrii]GLC60519.1 hypothetical protein PLESTB_001622600 [Pleodorina starrii]GLC76625.1 hypothetical protein PLESTF_001807100 [Pleodorina starrii]
MQAARRLRLSASFQGRRRRPCTRGGPFLCTAAAHIPNRLTESAVLPYHASYGATATAAAAGTAAPLAAAAPARSTPQALAAAAAAAASPAGAVAPRPALLPPPGPSGVLVAYYADHWRVPLPPGHRFPMEKYAATHGSLEADPSLEGLVQLRAAPPVDFEDVTLVHEPAYVERFRCNHMTEPEMRNVGFPWSEQLVGRTFASCGGTVAAMHVVMQRHQQQGGGAIAGNIAGGTHHAFRDRGEGFCVFNDIAVAANVAMRDYGLDSILVVDLDVHQGNGTADIFQNDPRVTTFDMFGDKNYPWKTRRTNTYDVPLRDETGDEEYLALLRSWLPRLLRDHRPQLILFQAGVDALRGDSFGRLGMSRSGLLARNNLVYGTALEAGVPLVITMGGGYTRPMDASVSCHTDVYRTAAYRLAAWARSTPRGQD